MVIFYSQLRSFWETCFFFVISITQVFFPSTFTHRMLRKCLFVHLFRWSFCHSFIYYFFVRSFVCLCVNYYCYSFVLSYIDSSLVRLYNVFIHSSNHSLLRIFERWCIRSFFHSFHPSLFHSINRSHYISETCLNDLFVSCFK